MVVDINTRRETCADGGSHLDKQGARSYPRPGKVAVDVVVGLSVCLFKCSSGDNKPVTS